MISNPESNPTMAGMASEPGVGTDKTVERLKQGAHDAVDRIADKAGPTVERLKSSLDSASTSVRSQVDGMHAMQEEWMVTARAKVRENPLTAVALAAAAGLLLGRITGR
jgi:ElaB/YqjD/DUF883 family membrane-anchored ribosome-binding protein